MKLNRLFLFALMAMVLLILAAGCSERNPTDLEVSRADTNPVVWHDEIDPEVYFQPFFETHYTTVSIDSVYAYDGYAPDGARSVKFNIPPDGSALGPYTGGVVTSVGARDLTEYNALTFYARTNEPVTLDLAGFGNDNTGTSRYEAGRNNINLDRDWSFVVVPIPAPSRLVSERGLFTIAESCEERYLDGYDIWVDEIKYAKLSSIEPFRPAMPVVTRDYYFIGSTVNISGTSTVFRVDGGFVVVNHSGGYFDYVSSAPSVAVAEGSVVTVVGEGEAKITATLENPADPEAPVDVQGWVNLTGFASPTVAAAPPSYPAGDVISLFSASYDDILVDTWRTDWSTGSYATRVVAGTETKQYGSLGYVVILFENQPVNTTSMTHLHLDAYPPGGTKFEIKLACPPPPDWTLQAPPQVVVVLDGTTTPGFTAGTWNSWDIPLADFQYDPSTQPEDFDWTAINQIVFASTDAKLVLVDNILFRK